MGLASIGRRAGALAAPVLLSAFTFGAAAPAVAAVATGHVTPAIGVQPLYRSVGQPDAAGGDTVFTCQTAGTCYGPTQIRHAYGVDALKNLNGAGRTIVIVDAFQSPTMTQDLALFDQTFGLPDPPSFKQVAPDGLTPFDPNDGNMAGWSAEISLDVEWSHAIAPGANIVLVLAKSNDDVNILSAERYAIRHNLGDVISMSYGEAESCYDPKLDAQEHALFAEATAKGITLIASSGDDGAAQLTCDGSSAILSASTPANDPFVLGVGGTSLVANITGDYQSESAWNETDFGSSGGGYSQRYARPLYQVGAVKNTGRGVPDVAYNAAGVKGGVLVAWGAVYGPGSFFRFGGTSCGAPQWAGLTALADQAGHHRVGFINDQVYGLLHSPLYGKAFHDIKDGSNNSFDGITGYDTTRGWDPVTGVGSPIASTLVPLLALGLSDLITDVDREPDLGSRPTSFARPAWPVSPVS